MANADTNKKRNDPPGFVPRKAQTNDLLNRLQAFLPQMEAANQVDIDLQQQDESDSDDDDDDDESDVASHSKLLAKEKSTKDENESSPMIQIQFALTDPNNPMMELLANKNQNDNSDDNDDDDDDSHEEMDRSKKRAVTNLLRTETKTGRKDNFGNKDEKQTGKKKQKSLITELS
eukprot:scaffold397_cov111-Cylindrotheca_fusiformis.AAC.3